MAKKQKKVKSKADNYGLSVEYLEGGGFDPNHVRTLIYGESGVGKTRLASTWPNPFFCDVDKGMASVDLPVARQEIDDWNELNDVYAWLANERPKEFGTIVLDSLNEAQTVSMIDTVANFPTIHRSYDSLPSQSDYGKMLHDFDRMIRAFCRLPYNIVLVAQTTTRQFDTDLIMPQLIGKNTSRNITRMMDIVAYLFHAEDSEMTVSAAFNAVHYVTKDRSGRLPNVLEQPSHKKMAKYWGKK